jgi:CheY-like chemotaxis protein
MAHASEKRILVVDDEPDVRNYIATCIEDAGFQVDTAADGQEALEKVFADPPDLMTLDMVMPKKSGIKVLRELRAEERFANLPVIVVTAHANTDLGSDDVKMASAFSSGLRPRYTLEKPVTPEKLVSAIGEILDVEVDASDDSATSDRSKEDILKMIASSDEQTLRKIKEMFGNP